MTTTHRFAFALVLAAGCGHNPYLSDDEGADRPSGSFAGEHPDELSVPYALGTKVHVVAKQVDAKDAPSWSIASDAPNVLVVDSSMAKDGELGADLRAVGEGEAHLRLLDGSGKEQRSAAVSVRVPDGATLYSHARLRVVGRDNASLPKAVVTEARVLAGGKGVFAVTFRRGTQRLYGRGIVTTTQAPSVAVERMTTSGGPVNEWLFVSPSAAGTSDLVLRAGGTTLLTVPVVAVADADLATLTLTEELGKKRDDKEQTWLLADAHDKSGRSVDGVYSTFTLGGVAQTGKDDDKKTSGDLYRYEYQPGGAAREVVATHGALQAKRTISAYRGWVSDTTYLGCTVGLGRAGAAGSSGGAVAATAGAGLLLLLAARRRARCTMRA